MLEVSRPPRLLRQEPHPPGRQPRRWRGRGREPARPQRRRPLHHGQGHHGRGAAGGHRSASRAAISPACRSYRIARLGLGYVPENRDIFPSLTVRQNLLLGQKDPQRKETLAAGGHARHVPESYGPRGDTPGGRALGRRKADAHHVPHADGRSRTDHDRRADRGAGAADRQAGGRADRRDRAARRLPFCSSSRSCRSRSTSRHRVYVMGHGRIVFEGTPADLKANHEVRHEWLEV